MAKSRSIIRNGDGTACGREVSSKWRRLFKLIPDYDPIKAAGVGEWFDVTEAEYRLDFIETCCRHVKGELAGQTIRLEPWQRAALGCLFGWKRADGTRRYREALIFIPRKNSKTTMGSMIVCACAYLDHEPGGELYSTAAEIKQSKICFDITSGMIRQDADMKVNAEVFMRSIVFYNGESTYQALTAKAETKHGFNPSVVINDELHAHKTSDLTTAMESGMGSRRQPMFVHTSTSDFEREGSICNEKHDYGKKVCDGVIEDSSFLPIIYEATRDDDWTSEKTWAKANPNYGVSAYKEYIARKCKRAQDSPVYENEFKRLHLNIRTEQAVRWLVMADWDACGGEPIDKRSLRGQRCYGGLDLSTTTDISAYVRIFVDGARLIVVPQFWIPSECATKREKQDRAPYLTWAREGYVTMTPGNVIDYDCIRRDVLEIQDCTPAALIAVDPWNATQLSTQLQGDGLNLVDHRQGFASMTAPTKELEKLVVGKRLRHGSHPVLRWMASNAAAEMDAAGNIKPSKKKSPEKIDGIVALVMAISAMLGEEPDAECIYSTRDLIIL